VFASGIYAAAEGVRDTLGNMLVRSQLIDEPTLLEALDRQARAPFTRNRPGQMEPSRRRT
jgi:hypothetical protein